VDIGEVEAHCKEYEIRTIECVFPDAQGLPRGKRIPVRHFLDTAYHGFELANAALVWGRRCDVIQDVAYTNFDTGYPDMVAVPDLDSFRPVPWHPGAASVICDCTEPDGREVAVSTRHILKDVVARARALGYEPKVGVELEFYLLDSSGRPLYEEIDCYSLTRGAVLEPFMQRLRDDLAAMGVAIEACNTEFGPAQVEMNMRYADALEAVDNTLRFKMAVKEIAQEMGYRATFMAKPLPEQSGSGLHLHQSLTELDGGGNAFGPSTPGDLEGGLMGRYLAGLLERMPAITALGSPTVNAYKRIADHSFAPTQACWGVDNRTVGVRAIAGHDAANRLEWRGGAADANPYLVAAACVAAGLDGVERGLEPPCRVIGDAYARTDLPLLPASFESALGVLEQDAFVGELLGEFRNVFVALGRHELSLWHAAVTDWERARYIDG
jgi:glutamine synthetase